MRIFTATGLKDLVVCEANVARAFEHRLKAKTPTSSHTLAFYNNWGTLRRMKRFSGIVGSQTVAVVGVALWEVRTMRFATGNVFEV